MRQTRREFIWSASAAAAGLALYGAQGVQWTVEEATAAGWEPGVENWLTSTCMVCPAHCGIRARVIDGRLVRLSGNPLHTMSQGGLCPRGIAGVQTLYHPDRIATPLFSADSRGDGDWQTISSDDGIARLAARLNAIRDGGRPEALTVVAGHCDGSMRDLWQQFLQAFGSPNYVADDYEDGLATVMSLMHDIPRQPGYDLERSELVLSFGAPLYDAWWSPVQAYAAFGGPPGTAQARRPRLVQIDTRFSRTAARASEWVGVRPATHAILALGIAYVLITAELYDADFVADHVSGFEDRVDAAGRVHEGYRSLILHNYRTEEVSAVTGVPVERIVALARAFGAADPAVAICGADVLFAPDGLLAGLAVHSLNVLAGNVNRIGGVVFGNAPPLAPFGPPELDATALAGVARRPIVGSDSPFAQRPSATSFAEAVASGAAAPPEVLLLYYSNPLASSTNPEAWREALSQIPFVVSFSPFMDETTAVANLILPDLLPYERWQDAPAPNSFPFSTWSVVRPLVEARTEGKHTGEVLLEVGRALGGGVASSMPWSDFEALLRARAEGLFAAQRGMTFGDQFERAHLRQMEERGWWLREYEEFDAFWDDLVARGGWTDLFHDTMDPAGLAETADGRIALMPPDLEAALEAEGRERRPYALDATPPRAPTGEYTLRLLPYRVSTLASGTVWLQPWLAEQPTIFANRHWYPWIEINPATASASGLDDDTLVWVTSARGRYRARVKLFPGAAPGTVCAPYGLRHPDGELANPLQLLDGSTDPLTGLPCWSTSMVRLERA